MIDVGISLTSKIPLGSMYAGLRSFERTKFLTIDGKDGYLTNVQVYGESTQASVPTPDVPVPIVSTTGNVMVRSASPSKNLFDAGVGITSGFYYDAYGTALVSAPDYIQTAFIPVLPNTTYTMSHAGSATPKIVQYTSGQVFISRAFAVGATSVTVTTGATTAFIRLSSATSQLATTQLELGSVATAFVPHNVSTQTLPLATTQLRSLPNGVSDRIYKDGSTWKLEQNVQELVFNGTENWSRAVNLNGRSRFQFNYNTLYPTAPKALNNATIASTTQQRSNMFTFYGASYNYGNVNTFEIDHSGFDAFVAMESTVDLPTFKALLVSNNLVINYPRATSLTTTITDPTLITALENIRTYQGVTNITASTPVSGSYS